MTQEVRFLVLDLFTRAVIVGAKIYQEISGSWQRIGTTDANGTFRHFYDDPQSAENYKITKEGWWISYKTFTSVDWPAYNAQIVDLTNQEQILGTVIDSVSGAGISGALVNFEGRTDNTASDGSYVLVSLPTFTGAISFTKTGYVSLSQNITVQTGERKTLNVQMTPETPPPADSYDIQGVITDITTGFPIEGALVTFAGQAYSSLVSGAYFFPIMIPTSGNLIITKDGYETFTNFLIANTSPDQTINWAITPTGTLPPPAEQNVYQGIVKDAITELPIEGVTITAHFASVVSDGAGAFILISDVSWQANLIMSKTGYVTNNLSVFSNLIEENIIHEVYLVKEEEGLPPEIPPGTPLPGFWENIRSFFTNALSSIGFAVSAKIINSIQNLFESITGNSITETEAVNWLRYAPGVNLAHKMMFGTDIDGNPDESVTAGEVVELAIWMVPFPIKWPAKVIGSYAARRGLKPAVKTLEDIMANKAAIVAKGVTEQAVGKTVAAGSTPILKLLLKQMREKPLMAIFAIGEYPTLVVVSIFGYRYLLELLGVEPKQVSFQLKDLEDTWNSLRFEMSAAMKDEDIGRIAQIAINMEQILNRYKNFQEEKSDVIAQVGEAENIGLITIVMEDQLGRVQTKYKEAIKLEKEKLGVPPVTEPIIPIEPISPEEEVDEEGVPTTPEKKVEFELKKIGLVPNAWKVRITAVDADTGEKIFAGIKIDDTWIGKFTPAIIYLEPEATYHILIRREGYFDGEVDLTTDALPIEEEGGEM